MSEDLYELRDRARRAISRGDLAEAANVLVVAIRQTHVGENEYVALLNSLQHVLEQRGDVRGALTCAWYSAVHSNETLQGVRTLMQNAPPVDRARTLATLGDMNGAANEMETAGLVAAAAIYREMSC